MAGTISENATSRGFSVGQQTGRELVFDVQNTEDEAEVETLISGVAPSSYGGLALDSISAEPQGGGLWKGYARYVRVTGTSEYTFDTGGGTTKVTQSLGTVNAYAPAGFTAPDYQGAIGVSEDKVEGVDVVSPTYQFSETHLLDSSTVSGAYKLILFNMTGRINNATFKGLAAGECLFLGASGTGRGDGMWSITYRFTASPNATGLTVGDVTGIDKYGWDYLWVRYADFEDTAAVALVKRPVAVYVERVYQPGDFSTLGIGTT